MDDDYIEVDKIHVSRIKKLFDALISEDVRFQFETPFSSTSIDTVTAAYGGGWGEGAVVTVYCHRADLSRYTPVRNFALNISKPKLEKGT